MNIWCWGLVLLLAIVAPSVSGRKWQYDQYPALRDSRCRSPDQDSLICDPDEVLTEGNRTQLNSLLKGIRTSTTCPCGEGKCQGGSHGYQVGLAVLKEMDVDDSYQDQSMAQRRLHAAYRLAGHLLSTTWQIGRCDEDAIIIYSKRDGVVYIVTSSMTRKVLPDQRVGEIIRDSMQAFANGTRPFRGLERVIKQVGDSVRGSYRRHHYATYNDQEETRSGDPAEQRESRQNGDTGDSQRVATSLATLVLLLLTALVL